MTNMKNALRANENDRISKSMGFARSKARTIVQNSTNEFCRTTGMLETPIRDMKNVLDALDPKLAKIILPWALKNPRYILNFGRLIRSYMDAKDKRKSAAKDGLIVPPVLMLSITSACNLACSGCYAAALGSTGSGRGSIRTGSDTISENTSSRACAENAAGDMREKQFLGVDAWRKLISEARELGVFCYVLAGGEPFLFPNLLGLCEEFNDNLFIIVTNGTVISDSDASRLGKLSNTVVLISIEGGERDTDSRRGKGVYNAAMDAVRRLNKQGTITGTSATITRSNYAYWMDEKNVDAMIDMGIKIGVFMEYIPVDSSIQNCGIKSPIESSIKSPLMLTREEGASFRKKMMGYHASKPIYIIHSPGDEEYFGGCVSAGRGVAHITPSGDLTPCPISNIATHNILSAPLRDGLASPLFKKIRENRRLLETDGSPCALFAHPKEVDELAKAVGAYRTT